VQAIGRCKLLLSEALHGAIVADALRVPWVAIRPLASVHRAKWWDWADTMGLRPRFFKLPASTLSEWAGAGPLGSFHATRAWLRRQDDRLARMTPDRLVAGAGLALRQAANADPQLSADTTLDRCQSRMLEAVRAMRTEPLRGAFRSGSSPDPRSCLQANDESAYQLTPIG
jgi:succinoglycan biosynthesis protein ExoV